MMAPPVLDRFRARCDELFDALVDSKRCEFTLLALLAIYALLWTTYAVISKSSQDIHPDMGELIAWSREASFGTPKHPPLAAWVVGLWFTVLPLTDWAYYALAVVSSTLSLWMTWRLSSTFLCAEKRAIGIMLLTLVPFYNFHALKFNANSILIPCWAAATWWFFRSLETRRPVWAILAGIGAAAAMLGKYWSIFLLIGLGLAALLSPHRRPYFRSVAPLLTVIAGCAVIAPHLVWVVEHDFAPFHYAVGVHQGTVWTAAESSLKFIVGVGAYICVPIGFGLFAARADKNIILDTLFPMAPQRRMLVIGFGAPLLLPTLVAILMREEIASVWAMPAMTLLPSVLLSSPLLKVRRQDALPLLAAAVFFPILMVFVSPGVAAVTHRVGVKDHASQYRLIAAAVEHNWRKHTREPLQIVGSYAELANGVIFYFADRPTTFDVVGHQQTPWVDEDRIKRQGVAIVCPIDMAECVRAMDSYATRYPLGSVEEAALARQYMGSSEPSVHYRILIIPPQISH